MTVNDVIALVDELRPNAIPEGTKTAWIMQLEARIAELYSKFRDLSEQADAAGGFPPDADGERELLAPDGYTAVYVHWLTFKVDFAVADMARASDDGAMYNQSFDELAAWAAREHRAKACGFIKV